MAHTNGIEGVLEHAQKRAHKGVYHKISAEALAALCQRILQAATGCASAIRWTRCNRSLQGWSGSG